MTEENLQVTVANYSLQDKLYSGSHFDIYRASRLQDQQSVILKMPRTEQPSSWEITALHHEYYLLKHLNLPGVIRAKDLIQVGYRPIMILEDGGGEPLQKYLDNKPLDVDGFLQLSLQLVDIIGGLHQKHIIHKDIKPANIIIDLQTRQLKLIDLSISTQFSEEVPTDLDLNRLEGTLAYISPEQTGRINRPIDYRTDFYSLGVTFFEMLTGQLPFQADDALELVHSHIAKLPPSVLDFNPKIPPILAAIVAKLLAKMPEERYISALGLKADLKQCLNQWEQHHAISVFRLGEHDIQSSLQISHKLYGRETQIDQLVDAFKKTAQGGIELLLISGYSGTGKTSLVKEIHKQIVEQKGYFIEGKFDQLQRSIPYSAVIEAFRSLVKQVLVESEAKLASFKQELLKTLGNIGKVVIDVIPEVEFIIGKQPPVPALNPTEAQNRFNLAFENFIQVFTQADHPLVIFLDDLQWADYASLKFIENLMLDTNTKYLLIIGAYRSNEVGADHPLHLVTQSLTHSNVLIETIHLEPLTEENIQQLLSDTFNADKAEVKPLAELLITKTQGNPFFINEFLRTLAQEKLIVFSYEQKKWQWDFPKIQDHEATDNVVEFLLMKTRKLSESLQRILKIAASIGYTFDLRTVAKVSKNSVTETAKFLWEALQVSLIRTQDEGYRVTKLAAVDELLDEASTGQISYQFVHDRIQQAIYSQISPHDKQQIHLNIGRLLLKQYQDKSIEEQSIDTGTLFKMLDHLSNSLSLINDADEIKNVSQYSLKAGVKAKQSTAYRAAITYFNCGTTLLEKLGWQNTYDLLFVLYKELLECEYLVSDFDKATEHYQMLVRKAKTKYDKSALYQIKIRMYVSQGKLHEAMLEGLEALKLFNIKLPLHPGKLQLLKDILAVRLRIGFGGIEKLEHSLHESTESWHTIIMQTMFAISTALFLFNPILFGVLVCRGLQEILDHGYSRETSSGWAAYAMLLMRLNRHKDALKFVELGQKFADKYQDAISKSRYYQIISSNIGHWYFPFSKAIENTEMSYQYALEAGELIYATWAAVTRIRFLHTMGNPLNKLPKETERVKEFTSRFKYGEYNYLLELYLQFFKNLIAEPEASKENITALFDKIKKQENNIICGNAYTLMIAYLYFMEDYVGALQMAKEGAKYQPFCYYMIFHTEYELYYALSLAACYEKAEPGTQKSYLKQLRKIKKQYKQWASLAPVNYRDKYLLIAAHVATMENKNNEAAELFEQAIKTAEKNGYIQNVAIACECAAKYYLKLKNLRLAKSYLADAYYAYQRWGAVAKCRLLLAKYSPGLLTVDVETAVSSVATSTTQIQSLDTLSILKSAQVISSEIILENLLVKLMQISLENAGAEKGYLIVELGGRWWVKAEGHIDHRGVNISNEPLENFKELPKSLIAYVQRTQENVVLSDARYISVYAKDPYIVEFHPKSVLCMPIVRKGQTKGILYLENNATPDAFTARHIQVLTMLSSQAAISLDNAELYTMSERFVPHHFLDQLHKTSLVDVRLGDQIEQVLTVLFCDIRGFTTLSEQLSPAEIFQLINKFLGSMEPVITRHNGFIDKYIGDAIMALFSKSADDAVAAAIDMIKALAEFNENQKREGQPILKIGIGINTGDLMLGIIGTSKRMESSVIGNAVNIASRIEGLTKEFQTAILISEETRLNLVHPEYFNLKFLKETLIRGKVQPVKIWQVETAPVQSG